MVAPLVDRSLLATTAASRAAEISAEGISARINIYTGDEHGIRMTVISADANAEFPLTPTLVALDDPDPAISLREVDDPVRAAVGCMNVEVCSLPLTVVVTTADVSPCR